MATLTEIGSHRIIAISPKATVAEALSKMASNHIRSLLVLEEDHVTGIFTERDLVDRVLLRKKAPEKTLVGDTMTKKVTTISEEASLDEAISTMIRGNFRHLPVVSTDGNPTGMVSMRDLLSQKIEKLNIENKDLAGYIINDAPGG